MTPSITIPQQEGTDDPLASSAHRRIARLISVWSQPVLQTAWCRIFLFATLAAICLTRAYIGMAGSEGFSHDAFMVFDGAWRILNGQHPHTDFFSHLGLVTYLPAVLGMWMTSYSADGFAYGQALLAMMLGCWAYWLGRRYLLDLPAALMCISVTVIAGSPAALGFSLVMVSPAMTYNRWGYAIFALILIEAFGGAKKLSRQDDLAGGVSSGIALSLLLFLKITYFVAAGFVLLAMILLTLPGRKYVLAIAAGFAAMSACFAAYFRFNLLPMFQDLHAISGAKHVRLRFYSVDSIFQNTGTVLVLVMLAAALLWKYSGKAAARYVAIGGACMCLAGMLLVLGNYEQNGFALAPFLALLLIDAVAIYHPGRRSLDVAYAGLLLLGSVLIGTSFISGGAILPFGVAQKILKVPRAAHFDAPVLAGFIPIEVDESYTAFVNDGLHLLRTFRKPGETVMSLDFTNPFSYALGSKPAPGGTVVLQYRTTFDDTHRQTPESLFGSADLVMLPQPASFSDETLTSSIVRLYGPYLESHFGKVGESRAWILYRRH